MDKHSLQALIKEADSCRECILGEQRVSRGGAIVYGEGPVPARGMIIGESPGPQEEREIRPFFPDAEAGRVLAKAMAKAGLDRQDWFLTNAVVCAPLQNGRVAPNKEEIYKTAIPACSKRLEKILDAVSPKILVLLGKPAYTSIFGYTRSMRQVLGWQAHPRFDVFVSWHPAHYARKKSDPNKNKIEVQNLAKQIIGHWLEIAKKFSERQKSKIP